MSLLKLTRTYQLETGETKDTIINLLNRRVDKAKTDKSWFSFDNINYKKITVGINRMAINRRGTSRMDFRGSGAIIISFKETTDDVTIVNAVIKPIKILLAIYILSIFIALMATFVIWSSNSFIPLLYILPVWLAFIAFLYIQAVINRYFLKTYTESVLYDLGINEKLSMVK